PTFVQDTALLHHPEPSLSNMANTLESNTAKAIEPISDTTQASTKTYEPQLDELSTDTIPTMMPTDSSIHDASLQLSAEAFAPQPNDLTTNTDPTMTWV